MKASTEFNVGKNNIAWVDQDFSDNFYDMEFEKGEKLTEVRTLSRIMTGQEILDELGPEPVTLGDVLATVQETDEKDWLGFFVKNKDGIIFAVFVFCYADDRGWHVLAYSVAHRYGWNAGRRVFSRNWSHGNSVASDPVHSGNLDTLTLSERVENLEKKVADMERKIRSEIHPNF